MGLIPYIISWDVCNARCVDLQIEVIRRSGSDLWWVNSYMKYGVTVGDTVIW